MFGFPEAFVISERTEFYKQFEEWKNNWANKKTALTGGLFITTSSLDCSINPPLLPNSLPGALPDQVINCPRITNKKSRPVKIG